LRKQLVRLVAALALLVGLAGSGIPTADVVSDVVSVPDRASAMSNGRIVVRKIKRYQRMTWRWQRLMGSRRTPNLKRYVKTRDPEFRRHVMHQWRRRAVTARRRALNPPHEAAWRCLQQYEASWADSGDPYWGGLQMDRGFMLHYAPAHLLRRGWADTWSPVEQMWVGERAIRAGRGFYPWPSTARICGLI
jgi:hypothetical protein